MVREVWGNMRYKSNLLALDFLELVGVEKDVVLGQILHQSTSLQFSHATIACYLEDYDNMSLSSFLLSVVCLVEILKIGFDWKVIVRIIPFCFVVVDDFYCSLARLEDLFLQPFHRGKKAKR